MVETLRLKWLAISLTVMPLASIRTTSCSLADNRDSRNGLLVFANIVRKRSLR
ncbi:hypothetical protein D3C86_2101910 [compost metagenome]